MLQRIHAPRPSPASAPSPLNPAFAPRPFAARTTAGALHAGATPTAASGGRPLP
ncbi:MAG TPA: hypothetical protein VFQ39_10730 [Longimicrobium sp.]|nr:hypothetical protein [Longimicrobium sp.]